MGLQARKSLIRRAVERARDERPARRRRDGARGARGRAALFEESKYRRAAAGHRGMSGAGFPQRVHDPPDLRMTGGNGRLEIVDEDLARLPAFAPQALRRVHHSSLVTPASGGGIGSRSFGSVTRSPRDHARWREDNGSLEREPFRRATTITIPPAERILRADAEVRQHEHNP